MDPLTADNSRVAVEILQAYNDGAGVKYSCLCCSYAVQSSGIGIMKHMERNPSKLLVWGIALDNGGKELGYVAMTLYPMQPMDGLHTTKSGEAYIEQLLVSSSARGKGARLLQCANLQLSRWKF